MARTEIEAIRELLASRPRPTGWAGRRQRLDELASSWPIAAEVAVTLETWPEMIHVWHQWHSRLEPGQEALAHAGAFIRQHD